MTPLFDPLLIFIDAVFDHSVSKRAWYWDEDAPGLLGKDGDLSWWEPPERVLEHLAETFERGGELLLRFSDDQLAQGFWLLFDTSGCVFMSAVLDEDVPFAIRLRALRSWVPLFEQVMVPRCSQDFWTKEDPEKPLDGACDMWFDCLLARFAPERLAASGLAQEFLVVLERVLAIPHAACQASALHGIGHWVRQYPQLAETVDEFLKCNSQLPTELVGYALRARAGNVK